MKKCLLLISLIIMSVFNMGCDDVLSDAALMALASDSGDKSQVIMEITGKVAERLISEGKAKTVTYEGDNEFFKGKTFIMPVDPYTYDDMQYALELALNSKFGDKWVKYLNLMLNKTEEKEFEYNEIPEEISPVVNKYVFSIAATQNGVQDTGMIPYTFENIGYSAEAQAKQKKAAIPIPYGGFIWWFGITRFSMNFYFIDETYTADSVAFQLYDGYGNLFTWDSNKETTIIIRDRNDVYLETTRYTKFWGYKELYTTMWNISIYDGEIAENWIELF